MSIQNDASITRDTSEQIDAKPPDVVRKRRRDEQEAFAIDRRTFSIRSDTLDLFAKPRVFTPLCLLPRSRLPLAYLDTAHDGSRLFSAHVSILEAGGGHESGDVVLIVNDSDEARLYAIERVQKRRYALCRLAAHVGAQDLAERTSQDVHGAGCRSKRRALQSLENGKPWWSCARFDVDVQLPRPDIMMPELPRLCMQTPADVMPTVASPTQLQPKAVDEDLPTPKAPMYPSTSRESSSPRRPLEDLTKQYLEALYISRLPLAFFVKGPLARARAALTSQPAELVNFLRGTILPAAVMDKKFRERIVELVKEYSVLEPHDPKPQQRKKRKWKAKRDKTGLFIDEKDYVEQWWRREDDGERISGPNETFDMAVKRRSQRLRNRETFLQVILIHEITALEASPPHDPLATRMDAGESQDVTLRDQEAQLNAKEKNPRKNKEIDVAVALATLLDRLCIWYSIENSSPIKNGTAAEDDGTRETNDDLKSFARDVIVPFFHSRIPELANATSGKLGGPQAPTPKRRTASKSRRPGEPAVRQAPEKKPRRPLARVSTDTTEYSSKRPPALHRAATDSDALVSTFKREMSETPSLHSIPVVKKGKPHPQTMQPKRVSLLEQASFGRREVDLSAMSQANDTKMRKKADVEAKLRDAITTLKKPNRERAVEEIAKNADQSFAKAIAKGRNQAQAQRKAGAEKGLPVVSASPGRIKATPAPKRRDERFAMNSRGSADTSFVPSSCTRLMARPGDAPSAIPQTGHRSRHSNVEETPSRGFAKFMPAGLAHQPGTLLESPTACRTVQIAQTPARPRSMASLSETSASKSHGLQTRTWSPTKLQNRGNMSEESPARDRNAGLADTQIGDRSIYDALGWNDEYDELA
ncbi:hypothetical protein DOTSEDRAFT_49701 [Dothistroma septosporum NZE10]|uniref:DNA replication regulator Sld3 C-terminal domain-containing protein n=1 Tax=Dothistroma septosporum (strain NZE10 / CBS 128990) TaxID=675120 RepID=N1Q4B8_DOTSN|nr:hypothetical protein DOTSEDRAFT_49701 [Dothistroma septosporum NZE10]